MKPIDRPDPRYRWRYLIAAFKCGYVHKSMQKFICIARGGNPQSEWCFDLWGSTNEAIAPPLGGRYE